MRIVYVIHSSFLVRAASDVLLFDWSELGCDVRRTREIVRENLKPEDRLFVFNSHGHGDHFSPEVLDFARFAGETHFILGHDILAAHPQLAPSSLAVARPDKTLQIAGLTVECPRANDCDNESVSFLLEFHGRRIWFGADMAWWDWPRMSAAERQAERDFFDHRVQQLAARPLDLAFVNADPRLANWAGGLEFARRLQPELFIPMHSFGREDALQPFREELAGSYHGRVFAYEKSGDSLEWPDR